MSIIFHITTLAAFKEAQKSGQYLHASLKDEGFIHCSKHYQVCDVANIIFKGQKNLILMAIDESKVKNEIKYEGTSWNAFPHIYGPINLQAVVSTFDFFESLNGFELPSPALNLALESLANKTIGPLYNYPQHYDAMYGSDGADVNFYIECALKSGGDILDLACGSGRFSLAIARRGLSVTGLDISASMLNHAIQKAKNNNLIIDFKLGDIRLFKLDRKFNFIFCGFNSSQHLHQESEFRSFIKCVKQHLKPDGFFAFDIFNPNISLLNRKETEKYLVTKYLDPDDGKEISVWENPSYDLARQLSTFLFSYEKEGVSFFTEKFSLRNYFPLEMDVLLRNCGIQILNKYGTFQKDKFSGHSMKQVFVCKADG